MIILSNLFLTTTQIKDVSRTVKHDFSKSQSITVAPDDILNVEMDVTRLIDLVREALMFSLLIPFKTERYNHYKNAIEQATAEHFRTTLIYYIALNNAYYDMINDPRFSTPDEIQLALADFDHDRYFWKVLSDECPAGVGRFENTQTHRQLVLSASFIRVVIQNHITHGLY